MQIEEWKNIKGYQGLYQVSNFGRVKSLNYNKTNKEKILIGGKVSRGYKRVLLSKNGKTKNFLIHRLVYTAFVGNVQDGFQIDHRDNNPENNRLDNLQLLTVSENIKKIYIDNPNLRYVNATKIKCIETNQIFSSQSEASRRLNLSCGNINSVLRGKRKKTKGYTFVYVDEPTEDKQQQNNIG